MQSQIPVCWKAQSKALLADGKRPRHVVFGLSSAAGVCGVQELDELDTSIHLLAILCLLSWKNQYNSVPNTSETMEPLSRVLHPCRMPDSLSSEDARLRQSKGRLRRTFGNGSPGSFPSVFGSCSCSLKSVCTRPFFWVKSCRQFVTRLPERLQNLTM